MAENADGIESATEPPSTYRLAAELSRAEYIQPPVDKNKIVKITFNPHYLGFDNHVDTNEVMGFISTLHELKDITGLSATAPYRLHNTGSTLYVKLQEDIPETVINQYIRPRTYTTKNNDDVTIIVEPMACQRTTVTIEGVDPEVTLNAVRKSLVRAQFFDPDKPENANKEWPIALSRPRHLRADQVQAKYECPAEEVPHFVDMTYYKVNDIKQYQTPLTLKVAGRRLVCYDCGSKTHRAGHSACKARRGAKKKGQKKDEEAKQRETTEDDTTWKTVQSKDERRREKKRGRDGHSIIANHSQSEASDSDSDDEMTNSTQDKRERHLEKEQQLMRKVEQALKEKRRAEREEGKRQKKLAQEKKKKEAEEEKAKQEKDRQENLFLEQERELVRIERLAQQQKQHELNKKANKQSVPLAPIPEERTEAESVSQRRAYQHMQAQQLKAATHDLLSHTPTHPLQQQHNTPHQTHQQQQLPSGGHGPPGPCHTPTDSTVHINPAKFVVGQAGDMTQNNMTNNSVPAFPTPTWGKGRGLTSPDFRGLDTSEFHTPPTHYYQDQAGLDFNNYHVTPRRDGEARTINNQVVGAARHGVLFADAPVDQFGGTFSEELSSGSPPNLQVDMSSVGEESMSDSQADLSQLGQTRFQETD